ncbi:EamA family transporter [Sulfitobacter sp. JBTF-M27]|uniref:EamA family transporter n=1 Tax=Sulfitobacter sediminilitoris TaxID=2698830 RepID=A0A6P0C9W4_9RHOB|nr:DMT family transporter [Sulfitobacter sediminilitoris]NEK22999.1 EamA family transporter [Sulfitobacter sediminilitoris]
MTKGQTGAVLVVVLALVFSTAGIFTKAVDAVAWNIIFWRGVSASAFTVGYLALRGALVREVMVFGRPALAVAVMMAAGTAAFIPAFKLTAVANVALIYGAAPFLAALLAWGYLRELSSLTVALASLAAFAGVVLIVSGSFAGNAWQGDLLALFMTLMMAGTMVVYRARPATTAALPAALSSVLLLPPAFYLGEPFSVTPAEIPLLVLFGLVFAVASVTLSEGARRLPASETALLSILEMPLAPMLAFAILAERPSLEVVTGGAVVFAAVLWSQKPKVRGRRSQ